MTVGRKKKTDPPVEWKVNVPQVIVAQVELLLLDPITHKTRYGARSKLVTQLLLQWLEIQREKKERRDKDEKVNCTTVSNKPNSSS